MITLTLFDLDSTLAHRDTGELLAGVARHFTLRPPARWAIVTNQGGVTQPVVTFYDADIDRYVSTK